LAILALSSPVSALTFSQESGRGFRRDGIGQPVTSLQANAKMYSSNGKPKVMAAAPRLYDIELLALILMKRTFPYGPPNSYSVVI
jgi:hypothetical protein